MSRLDERWVAKIFQKLTGVYGAQFRAKFSNVEDGVDVGLALAMDAWAEELGNFSDCPEAIAYALGHLPTDHAPNAIEFRDICRRYRPKEPPALPYKLTPEDHQRIAAAAGKAVRQMKSKIHDGIDAHWATHPRSVTQLQWIFSAAERDPRFRPCIAQMVEDGICTADGRLLRRYHDNQFVSV